MRKRRKDRRNWSTVVIKLDKYHVNFKRVPINSKDYRNFKRKSMETSFTCNYGMDMPARFPIRKWYKAYEEAIANSPLGYTGRYYSEI